MKTKLTTSLLALALAATFAYAQDGSATQGMQPQAAEVQTSKYTKPLEQDPLIRTGVLENGLRYIIRPTKESSGRASIHLYVNVGSMNETAEVSGVSHFIEHLVFNGSRTFKRGELIPVMQKLGLGFGGDANAFTSLYQTVYRLELPNLHEETVDFAFTIMRDYADGATLEDDAIDHERGIVISELHCSESEARRAADATYRMLAPGTRMPDFMPIGQESVLRNVPYEAVREYYHKNYIPSNMTLIIAGDITYGQGEEWARKYFSSMEPAQAEPRKPIEPLTNVGPEERIIPLNEAGATDITIAVVFPYEQKEDSLETRISDMPMELATMMLNRRLAREGRKADCPYLKASVEYTDMAEASQVFIVSITADPESWQEAIKAVDAQVRSACEYGFSGQELGELTTALITDQQKRCVTWESKTATDMAGGIVLSIRGHQLLTDPNEDLRAMEAGIHFISQEPDVCRRAIGSVYDGGRTKIIATGIIPEDMDEAALRRVFQEAQAVPAPKHGEAADLTFAYDAIGEPGHVTAREHLEDIDVTTLTLSNGVRVNLKPTTTQKGVILVTAMVDGGSFNLPQTPGLKRMVGVMMQLSGLEAHTEDDLERIFADKNVSVSFGIGADRFSFSGSTTREDAELECKYMVAGILHPGYRTDGETKLRRTLPSSYKKRDTTLEGVYGAGIPKIVFGDDMRFNEPALEAFDNVSTEDARNAVSPFLQEGAIEVTIVGDFDLEEMIGIVKRTFGAMPQRKTEFTPIAEEQRTTRVSEWGQTVFLPYPSTADRTIVAQIRPAGNGRDTKRVRRLSVVSSIVREKLFDGLRAELGQSYSPSVRVYANDEYTDSAFLLMSSKGVKGNRELVDSAINCICTILGQEGITEDDFECAIRPIITSMEKEMDTNPFWMGALCCIQSKPEDLQDLRSIKEDLANITYEEIDSLVKEIFGKDNAHHVFTVPADYLDAAQPE